MPCDYPSLTGPIRDRKSMDPVRALTGHHGPRATCKQIVRTFEITTAYGCSEARTASSRTRRVSARVRMVPARVPYGIRKVHARVLAISDQNTQRTYTARVCMWPCTSHEGNFVHVLLKCRTVPQVLRSRDHPYVSCDLSIFLFVIDHLCARIVSVTASSVTAAVRVRVQL